MLDMIPTINIPESKYPRVIIIGGGFAGLTLAKKLASRDFQIVLIDKNNFHQFQPLFYQVAMSGLEPSSISFPFRKLFQKKENIHIRIAEVKEVKHKEREVVTSSGSLRFDYLVIATGTDTNFFNNEQLKKHTLPMKSVSEALFLRNSILEDYEKAVTAPDYDSRQLYLDIVIVGGGPTGVEVAGALAEMRKYVIPKDYQELNSDEIDIYLLEGAPRLLSGMSEKAGKSAERFLKQLGVKVMTNAMVAECREGKVILKDGEEITAGKVIWAAGVKGNQIPGLPETSYVKGGRLLVDRQNKVEGTKDIFALGDIAFMKEENYPEGHPQVAQVAIQQADHLGKNLLRIHQEKTPLPFSYKDKGSMATIGRNKAVADLPAFHTSGFFAWTIWMLVHLFSLIGARNRIIVFINWIWNYFTYDHSLRLIIRPKNNS
jgi:NADH dehydrogenase